VTGRHRLFEHASQFLRGRATQRCITTDGLQQFNGVRHVLPLSRVIVMQLLDGSSPPMPRGHQLDIGRYQHLLIAQCAVKACLSPKAFIA
jgi:hypothetical protein